MIDYNKILDRSAAMRAKAKPFKLKHEGRSYTLVPSYSGGFHWALIDEGGVELARIVGNSRNAAKRNAVWWLS